MKAHNSLLILLLSFAAPLSLTQHSTVNASQVVDGWRAAVHSDKASHSAVITTVSTEDGIPGTVQDWISDADFRREVQRYVDESQLLLTKQRKERRDWNGWVRKVEGQELERFTTGVDEERVIAFGPPPEMGSAEVSESTGTMYSYGTSFRFEFFDLPEGYSYADIAKIHSGMVYSQARGLAAFTMDALKEIQTYREKPFFSCYLKEL